MSDKLSQLRDLVQGAISQRMFPGAVAYVSRQGQPLFHEAFGATVWPSPIRPMRPIALDDRFDLASLTKLYTTALVLRLVERGILRLDDRVSRHVPGDGGPVARSLPATGKLPSGSPRAAEVEAGWTLEDLLAHRTGTTADLLGRALRHGIHPCEARQEAALWCVIFSCEAEVPLAIGQSHYSDVDFLLAQAVCERAAGRSLDALMASEVFEPLGLRDTGFRPSDPARCVPTEVDDRWRHRLVVGEVHDEIAATLGGVAGHAGLFATAGEVGRFCEMWLGEEGREDRGRGRERGRLEAAMEPHSDSFGLGRLCNGSFFPSLARYDAVGHLGFTGTSAFLFPRSSTVFVLLSNRVHPNRDAAPSRLPLLRQMAELVASWADRV